MLPNKLLLGLFLTKGASREWLRIIKGSESVEIYSQQA